MPLSNEDTVDADHVYVLMTDKYRISRNIRAQWYLQKLNTSIKLDAKTKIEEFDDEIDIISCFSMEQTESGGKELEHKNFNITTNSKFMFFSRKYSFVYIFDLSTSVTNVDIQHSSVLTDELFSALSKCLENLVKPFYVPGSSFLYEPDIYISILVYSPFYSCDTNNVIVHGYKLHLKNISELLETIKSRLYEFIDFLRTNIKNEREHLNGFTNSPNQLVSADVSLVNMIRFGLMTLNLLPENSHEGIVIITDGDISFPDSATLESALAQLRLSMISCSFIQIGSPPHPDSSFGHVPFNDFMRFFSNATFGAYIAISPTYKCQVEKNLFNLFHKAFLVWSFHVGYSSFHSELHKEDYHKNIWFIENPYFYSSYDDEYMAVFEHEGYKKDQHMIRKRQRENSINATLAQVLSYRLREGFIIKRVSLKPSENKIELLLVLPWRYNINIEYIINAIFQPDFVTADDDEQRSLTYEIVLESSYSFLHDVTCSSKKNFKSTYRSTTIKQYFATLTSFSNSDELGIHFHHFAKNEVYRSMPESIKNGVPLFYLPPNCNTPVISFTNDAHSKFSQYWKPICMLDVNMCQKSSLHTVQINILLKHDTPLPEYLYLPNANGRYDNIQCNQSMSFLNVMLKEWSSFVLLENHSYVKLINERNNSSCSFYLVRIISQPPCIVLHLAFIGGTSSSLRNQIVSDLTSKLKQCKLPTRNLSSSLVQNASAQLKEEEEESSQPRLKDESDELDQSKPTDKISDFKAKGDLGTNNNSLVSTSASSSEKRIRNVSGNASCFVLLDRPIERMLIRYEKIPRDFFTCYKYEEDLRASNIPHASLNMFQTLTRYLCHKRFIWSTHCSPHTQRLNISSVSKILSVLTMKRIQEGFHLAYNDCGIVNLVMELTMRDEVGVEFPCLVQYIIFPSNVFVQSKDSISVDDYDEESSAECGEHLIVTECWVEPQNGTVVSGEEGQLLHGLNYEQVSLSFYDSDKQVINDLLTYEHLVSFTTFDPECPMCPEELYRPIPSPTGGHCEGDSPPQYDTLSESVKTPLPLSRFNLSRYSFDLLNLLRTSQQALIKFSMLIQSFDDSTSHEDPQTSQDHSTTDTVTSSSATSRFHHSDCINMILYSSFLLKLLHMHNKELEFSHADSISFLKLVNERGSQCNSELYFDIEKLSADSTVRLKCFCKQISEHCLVLTILPYSYQVVRTLSSVYDDTCRNQKLISELTVDDTLPPHGSLVMPIFVYKVTFQNLSNILLNLNDGLVTEGTNGNLFFDFSLSCNKFFFEPEVKPVDPLAPQSEEIALEHFCKGIETLYWNSFTDAIYKSLQYGYEVDERDVRLVLEKISLKFFHYLDITEFLIYTCRHLKPLVRAYFERYPNQSINNLIEHLLCPESNNPEVNFELLTLKNIFADANLGICKTNSDVLKQSFLETVQAHFSAIPGGLGNYYFFDYENIQQEKFSFGANDVKAHRENLLRLYVGIENGSTDLHEVLRRPYKHGHGEKSDETPKVIKDEDDLPNYNDLSLILTKPSKPFFVGFSYSFTLKSGPQIFKTTTIPTCLFELFSVISDDTIEDIELENLRVLLNVEIITQNLERPLVPSKRISVVSNEGAVGDTIRYLYMTLDEFQVYKYLEFFNRIEWLIRDEIVAISHNSYVVCPTTLHMVMDHIIKTGKSNTSFNDKVELKFIVDNDKQCISSFQSMLRELNFSKFQLCELGEFFYVIHRSVPDPSKPDPDMPSLLFTSDQEDQFDSDHCLVLNEDYFSDLPRDMDKIVEYQLEENSNANLSPNFWLILHLEKEHKTNVVALYFHSRQNFYLYGLEIFNELKKALEMTCKKINQKLLLDRLDETRLCEDLLISAEDKDPYIKTNIRNTLNSTPISHLRMDMNMIEPDVELIEDKHFKLVAKNFPPSSFVCDIVWNKHFPLHPRLQSKDIAIRQVLTSFTVNNRNNLYVYRDKSGSVFYMRIYQIDCVHHPFSCKLNYSISDGASTNTDMTDLSNCFFDNIISSSDVYSTNEMNDSDKDNDSITSFTMSKTTEKINQQCVLLNVHGLSDPDRDIKEDMVGALQKKLDETLLDSLILMLTRNQKSKLMSEDVSFIQGHSSSFENFYFVINDNYNYTPYIMNIKSYIRQNLSNFMYNPKYVDSNVESHFKLKQNEEYHCVLDEDVFLLHSQQYMGKGSKGIACVILSIASKEKISTENASTFSLSKNDMNVFVYGNYDNITSVYSHEKESANVQFYINFQVWCCGKVEIDSLHEKLVDSIKSSLWDFNLEFKIFKLCAFDENRITLNSVSEPSTPKRHNDKKERRSGLSIITGMSGESPNIRKMDRSSPHTAAAHVGDNSNENFFDFNNLELNDLSSSNTHEAKNKELTNLTHMLNVVVKSWLDYGKEIQVPSLKKYTFNIVLKNSISSIIKEFNSFIQNFSPDMNINFLMSYAQNYYEFDHEINGCNGENNNLMILLRHESLWNTRHLKWDMENSFSKLYAKVKNEKSKLHFTPVFASNRSLSDSNSNLNLIDSKGNEIEFQDCIAPRQKFLLLYVEDRYMTLYMYNWSTTYSSPIVSLFSNLIMWYNSRSLLLQSLIMQKAGIFHHLPFKRYSFEEILTLSNVQFKDLNLSQFLTQPTFNKEKTNFNSSIFKNTDLLLKHSNPLEAFKDFKENKDSLNKGDFIFDSKNYPFIFSGFEPSSASNLFDCFNGQFNSNYNVYIKDLKELSKVWQLHGSKLNYPIMEKITGHVKKYGRLSHFCLTPFLFSHKWRFYISLIRDHTLPTNSSRSRHVSGGHILKSNSDHEFMVNKRSRRKSGPPNILEFTTLAHRNSTDEGLDMAVCPHYIQEYVQYLQSLGFSSVKSPKGSNAMAKRNFEIDKRNDRFKGGVAFGRKTSYKNEFDKFYSIKTLPGGFFIFEIGFCEPYVYSYLYSFDESRFYPWSKVDSYMSQHTTNFLDELDSIKARMHLHSFTHDFHLRAIHSYISGRQLFFHQGYHLISFLDDFIKYYQKAPNYARNQVKSGIIKYESTRISATQLYNYIIGHNKLYNLEVFRMNSPSLPERVSELNKEFVLIHLSSHRIPYNDESHQEDTFDVGVLVTYQKEALFVKENSLCLKFFLLLTSQRELFPKLFPISDNKGAFRPVRLLSTNSRKGSILLNETSENGTKVPTTTTSTTSGSTSLYPQFNRTLYDGFTGSSDLNASTYSGICDEKINYLGYFNAHEMLMLNIVSDKVKETKEKLRNIIMSAEIDCRRDYLWNCLMPSSAQIAEQQITLDEFNELLLYVKSIRFDEYDSNLALFYSFNYQWYKTLAHKLELKFEATHRKFQGKDSTQCKMAFFKTNCKDCFILFDLKTSIPIADFKIVFKRSPEIEIDCNFLQECNPQYHELVEDFINACTSHMWSVMLS